MYYITVLYYCTILLYYIILLYRLLAIGCNTTSGYTVNIYKVPHLILLYTLPCDNGLIYSISWTTNEQYIAVASSSGLCQ